MPQLKKPKSLEILAMKSLVRFLCDLGQSMMPIISELARHAVQRSSIILENRIKLLQQILQYNVPSLLYDDLCHEIFIQVPQLIDRIKGNLKFRTSMMGEFLSQVNVAVSLTEVIISNKLRKINFEEMPKMIRHVYYSKMHLLGGLQYLNLGSLSGGWKTNEMEPTVLSGITSMSNLQYFCLNYDCTDNILIALVLSCPLLHTLDVSSSKSVTNDSVHIIARLKNLRCIQLYRTAVSMEGYINLFLKVPQLEDIGRYDEVGRCLEYIVDHYPDKQKFNLTKFASRFVTTRFLQILSEHCPHIYFVSIFHNMLLCDLMMLIGINKLQDLRLLSCDFFADQVKNVLAVKGCNLTTLHLEHVDEIDMNALMYISQFCPDLKTLTFYNCELIESTSMYIKKPDIPPFLNLEKLTLIAACEFNHIEFLLGHCYKIKHVTLGTMVPTSDELFDRILSRNPLLLLEDLSIVCSEHLTIKTVYNLIESCQNLRVLNELEGWIRINETELKLLDLFIRTNNLDLCIESKRFMKCDKENLF